MKNENPEKTRRNLQVVAITALLSIALACNQVNKAQRVERAQGASDVIVFEGTLEVLGPDPGFGSGVLASYRLAKYRVDKICEGEYEGTEIIVDHRIFTLNEFEGINVNDRVCLTVKKTNDTNEMFSDNVLRRPTDDVKTRYITYGDLKRSSDNVFRVSDEDNSEPCSCSH